MNSELHGTYAFGETLRAVVQRDRAPKQVFILGVYASAVHARWFDADGSMTAGSPAMQVADCPARRVVLSELDDIQHKYPYQAPRDVLHQRPPMAQPRERQPATTGPSNGDAAFDASAKRWSRIGLRLVAGTMAYNVVEAVVAIWSGAHAESVALLGFGFDSVIECSAAGVLLWRLALETTGADHDRIEATERQVHRFVGATFIALAVYVVTQAGWILINREPPQESVIGIALAIASLLIMPTVSWAKIVAARHIGSKSVARRGEGDPRLLVSIVDIAPGPRSECHRRMVVG